MLLSIEKLVYGGYGLARTDNGVVFVEQVLPGETVKAEVVSKKGGAPIAIPREFIKKSSHRREPRCQYAGECGGCDWQHINYTQQIHFKHDIFIDCLKRIGKIDAIPEIEIIPSQEWAYRIRAQLKVNSKKQRIGFYREKTNDVMSIKKCPLLCPQINNILEDQDKIVPVLPRHIKQVKVIAGTNGSITSTPVIKNYSEEKTEIMVGKKIFTVTGNSFFQGNRFLLEKLGTWVKSFVSGEFFIDMYGGVGFLSVMLGKKFSHGLLVESVKWQVEQAKDNFILNNMDNLNAKTMSAEIFFAEGQNSIPQPDCLIVDPPRSGLTRMVREGICDLKPYTIVYISCNPSTQARDIGFFKKKCGYSIEKGALFDLYPQTHHLETILLLRLC